LTPAARLLYRAGVDRRRFLVMPLAAVVAALPAAEAQQAQKVYRIGLIGVDAGERAGQAALRQGLRALGYEEGRNLVIEYREAEGRYDRLPALTAELIALKVDVLVTSSTPGARAAKQATTTIPVVVAIVGDAVAAGIVPNLAHPGGNITGTQFHFPDIMAKRIELLRQAIPSLARMAAIFNPSNQVASAGLRAMEATARVLSIELQPIAISSPQDFDATLTSLAQRRTDAFVVLDDPMLRSRGRTIAELATKRRVPSVGDQEYVKDGGLLGYAVNRPEVWRRAAVFVDKILKGANPGHLPFEQADRIELIINLKTAKALGLAIPPALLLRADQVIE
jgi:putative tryptophan/tyrosine transport system substrate-binding protein